MVLFFDIHYDETKIINLSLHEEQLKRKLQKNSERNIIIATMTSRKILKLTHSG